MKAALLTVTSAIALAAAGSAYSQTCASPLPISSEGGPYDVVSMNLCDAENSLPSYGGITSPQKEAIYSFVAEGANATIELEATDFTGVLYLMPSPCSDSTDPISIGNSVGTPMPVNGLTDGQTYYVIVTANPGGPEDACGMFTATVRGQLPVSIQDFSVE